MRKLDLNRKVTLSRPVNAVRVSSVTDVIHGWRTDLKEMIIKYYEMHHPQNLFLLILFIEAKVQYIKKTTTNTY